MSQKTKKIEKYMKYNHTILTAMVNKGEIPYRLNPIHTEVFPNSAPERRLNQIFYDFFYRGTL